MSHNTTAFLESQASSTRTVFDILWSCLFTIFACTWTVQHLNVPLQRDECGIKPGWKGDLEYGLRNFLRSAKWMAITILAPEMLITMNASQVSESYGTVEERKKYAEEDGVPWSSTHSLFANMGGFVLREFEPERANAACSHDRREGNKTKAPSQPVGPPAIGEDVRSKSESAAYVENKLEASNATPTGESSASEGMEITSQSASQRKPIENETEGNEIPEKKAAGDNGVSCGTQDAVHLELEAQTRQKPGSRFILADDFLRLRRRGIMKLPYITRDEIMDKGKNDTFARVLTICQTLWLVIQMIVRASRHIEVSQLEVGTAAFVGCALTIYAINWHKPKAVGVPWTVLSFAGPLPNEISNELKGYKPRYGRWTVDANRSALPNDHKHESDQEGLSLLLASIMFGAIHFAGLRSTFPSHVERVCWCAASAICTGVFLIAGILVAIELCCIRLAKAIFHVAHERNMSRFSTLFPFASIPLGLLLYILARLYLIVELFRCLFFLPLSAYVGTSVSSIPHVS